MQIDRMGLEDVGDNPKRLAAEIIEQIGITSGPVPIREIAAAADILEIREENLTSFEGALVTTSTKDVGSIIVRSDRIEKRKRFTIGHELGHFLIGYHRPSGARFECTARNMGASSFKPTDLATKMEVEANLFSAEILLPKKLLSPWMARRRDIDISHMIDMSLEFDVSKEAAARRFIDFAHEPIAFVFSKEGRIKYSLRHDDFPLLDARSGDQLPTESRTAKFSGNLGAVSNLTSVDQGLWLAGGRRGFVCEQTLIQRNGFRITLLTLPDNDNEDDDESDWEPPKFRR